ncbi:hypothetical protein E2C01_078133 [Portunus trituberculatus]|uniref:Uncharacterized protein n=1 Tax=Portunus trituberculatus TaxID=210409 RepID=A0A5B7ITC1_PORTR|nr:hypothetical protein [Portunus trituberculatus]
MMQSGYDVLGAVYDDATTNTIPDTTLSSCQGITARCIYGNVNVAAVVQWNHARVGVTRGLQAHGFESCPRSECRLGFLTRGKGFLADGL